VPKNRGLQDILIACLDDLKGFPDAIAMSFLFPSSVTACIISFNMATVTQNYLQVRTIISLKE